MKLPVQDLDHILAHTRDLWQELRGERLFITGGTGFFGTWLLESFTRANDALNLKAVANVLSRNPASFLERAPHLASRSDLKFVSGDLETFEFPEGTFRFVIHAGTTSGEPMQPRKQFQTIVRGTQRVLDFAESHGTRRFLFVSSGAVYGTQPSNLSHVSEDFSGAPPCCDPASAYGEGKRAAELLCSTYAGDFDVLCARCFAFVGPHLPLDAHYAIGNFIRDALGGRTIRVSGDGMPYRSYLYAADLAIWLWVILFRGRSRRPYNVGSNQPVQIRALAESIADTAGMPGRVEVTGERRSEVPAPRYVPNTMRACEELNLQVWISQQDAIARTLEWHRWCAAAAPGKEC